MTVRKMANELSLLDHNGNPISNSLENPSVSLNDPEAWFELFGGGPTTAGVAVTPQKALSYPPLWRALNLISGDVARLPLNTYRRMPDGGKEKATAHPAYRLLRRKSSPVMRASAFKRTLTWHAMLHGNGLAFIVRNQLNVPREMLILDPTETAMAIVDGAIEYITYIGRDRVRLAGEDVFHIKGLSNNGLWGIDVLSLMREMLGLPIAAREYTSRFFGSGSQQSGILMVPASFPDEKIRNTIKYWNETATGLARSHKVALLKENVKFIPTTVTPKDSETTPILEHEIRTVSAIFGVPPHKIGDVTRTSYNSLEQEEAAYLQDGLDPWLHEWEEEADIKLLTEREQITESFFHEFNRRKRLQMDSAARATFYKGLFEMGVVSTNDIRKLESLATIGPEGDRRFRSTNLVPLDQVEETPNPQVQNAQKRMILEVLDKKSQIEAHKIKNALERDPDLFREWIDQFYAEHEGHLLEGLEPARRIVEAHQGRRLKSLWEKMVRAFLNERKTAVLAAKFDEIPEILGDFSHRKLVKQLLSERKRNDGT